MSSHPYFFQTDRAGAIARALKVQAYYFRVSKLAMYLLLLSGLAMVLIVGARYGEVASTLCALAAAIWFLLDFTVDESLRRKERDIAEFSTALDALDD